VVVHHSGGSLAALSVLSDYWGAVESDLYAGHYQWADVGTDRLPWCAFVSMLLNPAPVTSLYHQMTEGWGVAERLAALRLDALKMLLWTKSKDAYAKPPRNRPKPTWQPGHPEEEPEEKEYEVMTIEQYMERAGMA
jgi:hypothetical protein